MNAPFLNLATPIRYERKGESRRRRSWQGFGLVLGIALALLFSTPTRDLVFGEAAALLPPRNPLALFVTPSVKLSQEPDAMEAVADALSLPAIRYSDLPDVPLSKQEQKLIALSRSYPDRADVQAAFFVNTMPTRLRADRPDIMKGAKATPADLQKSVLHPLNPEYREAAHEAIERGIRLEPDNGFFRLMAAQYAFSLKQDAEAFRAVGESAQCKLWNAHTSEAVKGKLASTQLRFGMVIPAQRLYILEEAYYPGVYEFTQAGGLMRSIASEREKAGDAKSGYAIRMNLLSIGLKIYGSQNDLSYSLLPFSFVTRAFSRPADKKATEQDQYGRFVNLTGDHPVVLQYEAFLKANGMTKEASSLSQYRRTPPLFPKPMNEDIYDVSLKVMVSWGIGVAMLTAFLITLTLYGVLAYREHRNRFADYRLPKLTPEQIGGIWLGIFVIGIGLVSAYDFTEFGFLGFGMIVCLIFAGAFCAKTQPESSAASVVKTAGNLFALALSVFALIYGAVSSLAVYSAMDFTGTSVVDNLSDDANVVVHRITSLGVTAGVTGVVLGFFALVFVGCAIWAKIKRQPMTSGGLLHFRAVGVPLIALMLLGYIGSVLHTETLIRTSETQIQTLLRTRRI